MNEPSICGPIGVRATDRAEERAAWLLACKVRPKHGKTGISRHKLLTRRTGRTQSGPIYALWEIGNGAVHHRSGQCVTGIYAGRWCAIRSDDSAQISRKRNDYAGRNNGKINPAKPFCYGMAFSVKTEGKRVLIEILAVQVWYPRFPL